MVLKAIHQPNVLVIITACVNNLLESSLNTVQWIIRTGELGRIPELYMIQEV